MTDRVKRVVRDGLAVAGICVATVIVLEGAASLLLFAHDFIDSRAPALVIRPQTTPDTLLGWVSRANYANPNEYGRGIGRTTTAQGFRTTTPVDVAAAQLVCSGDGYTAGVGVADDRSWCALLGREFHGLQTLDMAEGAYGLDQAYLWYKRDGATTHPAVHIVGLTDIELNRAATADFDGRYKPTLGVENGRLITRGVPVPVQASHALDRAYAKRVFNDLGIVQIFRRIPAFDDVRAQNARVDAHWSAFEAMLDDLAATDRQRGAQLMLVYLPTLRDARPGTSDQRRQRLAAFAGKRSIQYVDLTPALRKLRKDSLDLAFISRILRNVPSVAVGQYSDLGNEWVARSLVPHLDSVPALARLRGPRSPPAKRATRATRE